MFHGYRWFEDPTFFSPMAVVNDTPLLIGETVTFNIIIDQGLIVEAIGKIRKFYKQVNN